MFYDELVSGNRITYVFVVDNEFVAEASFVFETDDPEYTISNQRLYLSRAITKDIYRHNGIATSLINHIISVAKDKGYQEITVGVDVNNEAALSLYKKLGFDEVLYRGFDKDREYYKLLKYISI